MLKATPLIPRSYISRYFNTIIYTQKNMYSFIWEVGDIYSQFLRSFTARGVSSGDPARV